MQAQYTQPFLASGQAHLNLPVETSGTQKRRVERIQAIGRRQYDYAVCRPEAGHFAQKRVQGLITFVGGLIVALFCHGVDFVDEYDALAGLARAFEQFAHAAGADAYVHLHEIRAGKRKKRYARFARQCPGQQRLACAGRPVKQHAARHARPVARVFLRVFEIVYQPLQACAGLLIGRHVAKTAVGRGAYGVQTRYTPRCFRPQRAWPQKRRGDEQRHRRGQAKARRRIYGRRAAAGKQRKYQPCEQQPHGADGNYVPGSLQINHLYALNHIYCNP